MINIEDIKLAFIGTTSEKIHIVDRHTNKSLCGRTSETIESVNDFCSDWTEVVMSMFFGCKACRMTAEKELEEENESI